MKKCIPDADQERQYQRQRAENMRTVLQPQE